MKENCKSCKKFFECSSNYQKLHGFSPNFSSMPCIEFESAKKHDYVLIHKRLDSCSYSIVAFDNSFVSLCNMRDNLPDFGKKNHDFYVVSNGPHSRVTDIVNDLKDGCLLNICKNVAYALGRAEYSMLKKKYSRSKSCFDSAKSMIITACYILDNY